MFYYHKGLTRAARRTVATAITIAGRQGCTAVDTGHLLLAVLLCAVCVPRWQHDVRENGREAIRNAVLHSAVECYAVEGVYPESLSYLEKNYGLTVNRQDYIITYEVFADNQLPSVQVLVRGEED